MVVCRNEPVDAGRSRRGLAGAWLIRPYLSTKRYCEAVPAVDGDDGQRYRSSTLTTGNSIFNNSDSAGCGYPALRGS